VELGLPLIYVHIVLFCFWNFILTRKMPVATKEPIPAPEVFREILYRGKRATLGLLMPLIILGRIYGGITTPTEAAAIAVIYAVPVSIWLYKDMDWKSLYEVLWKAGQIAGVLMVVVLFAAMLARLMTFENVPQQVLETFLAITENPMLLLLLINAFRLVIGMFMEDVSGILIATPMLMPLVNELNLDPVQFAAIVATNLGMGLITPPTAPILYFGALIGQTKLSSMLKYTFVFLLMGYLPVVLLTTFIPELSLWLPNLILGR
jgi:tripartite ATP-independent transporter DctM subunit